MGWWSIEETGQGIQRIWANRMTGGPKSKQRRKPGYRRVTMSIWSVTLGVDVSVSASPFAGKIDVTAYVDNCTPVLIDFAIFAKIYSTFACSHAYSLIHFLANLLWSIIALWDFDKTFDFSGKRVGVWLGRRCWYSNPQDDSPQSTGLSPFAILWLRMWSKIE